MRSKRCETTDALEEFGMHRRILRQAAALLLGGMLAANVAVAAASTSVTYEARGVEVYATATRGVFTGVAWAADDYGNWYAVVDHTAFDAARSATITGGTFELNGYRRDASGTFDAGGTVRLRSAEPGCGREVFDVDGTVTLAGGGTGVLDATLVHFRTSLFGRCITYSATVSGTVALTLP
jgi:hypothetical protein